MRIATWNCCRGPVARKLALLDELSPTISVVTECPRLATDSSACAWLGDSSGQGIQILAQPPYRLVASECREVPRYAFPVQVVGPHSFLLLAIWSKTDPEFRYVKAVHRAVEQYADRLRSHPTVVIGDFNSNAVFDDKYPSSANHSSLVRLLDSLDLVSAYHHFFGEPHGAESRPTFFLQRNPAKPFHIDFCFIPRSWCRLLSAVQVADHASWSQVSDHRPLVVDFDLSKPA